MSNALMFYSLSVRLVWYASQCTWLSGPPVWVTTEQCTLSNYPHWTRDKSCQVSWSQLCINLEVQKFTLCLITKKSVQWLVWVYDCFLTQNWLDQMITTNRIISSQVLIIIRSKRNTFIIRNQNKRKSSLNLVSKFKNFNVNLLLWRVVTTVSLYSLEDSPGKRI